MMLASLTAKGDSWVQAQRGLAIYSAVFDALMITGNLLRVPTANSAPSIAVALVSR